jgi:hypothetical protein
MHITPGPYLLHTTEKGVMNVGARFGLGEGLTRGSNHAGGPSLPYSVYKTPMGGPRAFAGHVGTWP